MAETDIISSLDVLDGDNGKVAFTRREFLTESTYVTVVGTGEFSGTFPTDCKLGVYKDRTLIAWPTVDTDGANSTVQLGTGTKRITIVDGGNLAIANPYLRNYPTSILVDGTTTPVVYSAPSRRLVVIGDSISQGSQTGNPQYAAWPMRLRNNGRYPGSVSCFGAGALYFYDIANTAQLIDNNTTIIAALLDGTSQNEIWFAAGFNDYNGDKWAAADFAGAVADFFTSLRSKSPNVRIYLQTILTTANNDENAFGETPDDYRSAVVTACSGLANLHAVNGNQGEYADVELSDGVHPTAAGTAIYAHAITESILAVDSTSGGRRAMYYSGSKAQVKVTAKASTIGGTLSNFAYPFKITDLPAAFLAKCREDRTDLRVFDSDGNALKSDVQTNGGVLTWDAPGGAAARDFYIEGGGDVKTNDSDTVDAAVCRLPFDESTGNYLDASGNGNNAAVQNAGDVTRGGAGKLGLCVQFGGTNGYLLINDADSLSFAPDGDFTVRGWYFAAAAANDVTFFRKVAASNVEYYVGIYSNNLPMIIKYNLAATVYEGRTSPKPTHGQWNMLVFQNDSGVLKIWADDTQIDNADLSSGGYTAMANGTAPVWIGRGDFYSNAKLCRLTVQNRALSNVEIAGLYRYENDPTSQYTIGEPVFKSSGSRQLTTGHGLGSFSKARKRSKWKGL